MFTPNSKLKKILGTYGTCAYIHRDGVVIRERKEIKVKGGNSTSIDVWHIVPCEIPIRVRDWTNQSNGYYGSGAPTVNRLVVHDCSLIANGFDYVAVSFNTHSPASEEKRLTINVVKFTQGNHVWQDMAIVGVTGGNVTIQPNPYDRFSSDGDSSILVYQDYSWRSGNSVIVYGDLPEIKTDVLQLTVNS